ncbi:MAG: hypothetical protein RLZZ436_3753 [Planctomycetota bacterium]
MGAGAGVWRTAKENAVGSTMSRLVVQGVFTSHFSLLTSHFEQPAFLYDS